MFHGSMHFIYLFFAATLEYTTPLLFMPALYYIIWYISTKQSNCLNVDVEDKRPFQFIQKRNQSLFNCILMYHSVNFPNAKLLRFFVLSKRFPSIRVKLYFEIWMEIIQKNCKISALLYLYVDFQSLWFFEIKFRVFCGVCPIISQFELMSAHN